MEEHPFGSLVWLSEEKTSAVAGVTVGRARIDPGKSNPLHFHANCSEIILLLQGSVDHVVGHERYQLVAGDLLIVPPGVPHQASSIGSDPADMIVVYNSGHRAFTVVGDSRAEGR
jgi:mannose-6-phosphate isomerase-like protein (cupin superfamily)